MKVFLAGGSGAIGKRLIPLLETMLVSARNLEGVALRYGAFYEPGTQIGPGGQMVEMVRKRMLPIFGTGARISFGSSFSF